MFILQASKDTLKVLQREAITSSPDYVYQVKFQFDDNWEGLEKHALFKVTGKCKVVEMVSDICAIPTEVILAGGTNLIAGVIGLQEETVVIPAIWTSLNRIPLNSNSGSGIPAGAVKPSGNGGTTSSSGSSGSGTTIKPNPSPNPGTQEPDPDTPVVTVTEHNQLSNRDADNAHPVSAITGLTAKLNQFDSRLSTQENQAKTNQEEMDKLSDRIEKTTVSRAMTAEEMKKILES